MKFKIIKAENGNVNNLPIGKGVYVLFIYVESDRNVTVGRLGEIRFTKGYYAYVGSAMKGVAVRIKAHMKKDKISHWHIDYLLKFSKLEKIAYVLTKKRVEDDIACLFEEYFEKTDGFGATDSPLCKSHLFFSTKKGAFEIFLENTIEDAINFT